LQQVEGIRPELEVRYVYPEGALPNDQVWVERIERSVGDRPVIVTSYFAAFDSLECQWQPFHGGWLTGAIDDDTMAVDSPSEPITFGDALEVVGHATSASTIVPGGTVTASVQWQPLRVLSRDYSSFVQLVGPGGVVGQQDIRHTAGACRPNALCTDSYDITVHMDTAPGSYELIAGFYHTDDAGWHRLESPDGDHLLLGRVEIKATNARPATAHTTRQSFANGMVLTGVDYDTSLPGQVRLITHWYRLDHLALLSDGTEDLAGPSRIRVESGAALIAEADLPALASGQGTSLAIDIAGSPTRARLSLIDGDSVVPRVGVWGVPSHEPTYLREPRSGEMFIPLGGAMAIVGLSVDASDDETSVQIRPQFAALKPLLRDYTVSAGIRSSDGWEYKHDGTPALGAIPTLKWLGGWSVRDQHTVSLAEGQSLDQAVVRLEVYDAFAHRSLAVLDDRYVRLGQGTFVEIDASVLQ